MLRHVAWFAGAPVAPNGKDGLISPDADVRQRCLLPARELETIGIACSVFGNLEEADPVHVSNHLQKLNADFVVLGKMTHTSLLKLARAAKHLGCYVVADYAASAQFATCLDELLGITDLIVVATPQQAETLKMSCGINPLVIEDSLDDPARCARQWFQCFSKLKEKPPLCANTNKPVEFRV